MKLKKGGVTLKGKMGVEVLSEKGRKGLIVESPLRTSPLSPRAKALGGLKRKKLTIRWG